MLVRGRTWPIPWSMAAVLLGTIQSIDEALKRLETLAQTTGRCGLTFHPEVPCAMRIEIVTNRDLPEPWSERGLPPAADVTPLSLVLYGGGETMENDCELIENPTLRMAIDHKIVPFASAIGDWLNQMGSMRSIQGMAHVTEAIAEKVLKQDKRTSYTLPIDTALIEAKEQAAQAACLIEKGYRPVPATPRELELFIVYAFLEENVTIGKVEILKEAFRRIPVCKTIDIILLDAEYYTDDVMAYLNERDVNWVIATDGDAAVRQTIQALPEQAWRPLRIGDGLTTYGEVAEIMHGTNKGQGAFRLIVLRWRNPRKDLFTDGYHYHTIATKTLDETPEAVV